MSCPPSFSCTILCQRFALVYSCLVNKLANEKAENKWTDLRSRGHRGPGVRLNGPAFHVDSSSVPRHRNNIHSMNGPARGNATAEFKRAQCCRYTHKKRLKRRARFLQLRIVHPFIHPRHCRSLQILRVIDVMAAQSQEGLLLD